MSITINAKQDYSMLFSSLNSSGNNTTSALYGINLSDYASIKNGSYGRLLKAYYQKQDNDAESTTSSSSTKEQANVTVKKELTAVQEYATDLSNSASALMQKGSKSVFKDGDTEKIYEAVSSFTKDYNTLMEKSLDSSSTSVVKGANSLADTVEGYEDSLKAIGITIGEDKQLSLDKDTFMKADMDKVKELFNGNSSLSYLVSVKAVSLGNTAFSESNKASLYTNSGTYSTISTGDLFNSIV